RLFRRPVLGELAMGSINRRLIGRALRRGGTTATAWSDAELDTVWEDFDQGTQRATLRLVRDASPERPEAAGAGLGRLPQPALVLWGEDDPWLPPAHARAYAERLPGGELELVPGAGHWPWRDEPRVVDRVAAFLG